MYYNNKVENNAILVNTLKWFKNRHFLIHLDRFHGFYIEYFLKIYKNNSASLSLERSYVFYYYFLSIIKYQTISTHAI